MPRSFLVKKVKLDTFSSADLESSYGRARSDLGVRLHEKGESWAEAGGGEEPWETLEGVEGQSVGVKGAEAPGNRPLGTRSAGGGGWNPTVEGDGDGRWGKGKAETGQNQSKAGQGASVQERGWGTGVRNRRYTLNHTMSHARTNSCTDTCWHDRT